MVMLTAFSLAAHAEDPLRFSVLNFRPKEPAKAKWQPFVKYLEAALDRKVELTLYTYSELNTAVRQHAVDVVLTNPGHYIMLKHYNQLSAPLATQITRAGGQDISMFGGVIFTRNDAPHINALADIAGKKIAISSVDSLGSYQMEAFELFQAGIPLPKKRTFADYRPAPGPRSGSRAGRPRRSGLCAHRPT